MTICFRRMVLTAATLAACAACAVAASVEPLSESAAQEWLRHVLPLPHRVSIPRRATLHPGDVGVTLRRGAGDIEQAAAAGLTSLFEDKAGTAPSGKVFEIVIGVADADGKVEGHPVAGIGRLKDVPNAGQAYLIQPLGTDRLILTARDARGVYYAAQTLRQLLEPFLTESEVVIPLATVVDWPDIEERGLWNYPLEWMPWLASMKLNYGRMGAKLHTIKRGEPNRATVDVELYRAAQRQAFHCLPDITHLNFLGRRGLYRAYPELAGVGDGALAGRYVAHKQGDQHRAPCASQPLLTDILAEWMTDVASQGVGELGCWISERPCQCGCADCTAVGQFVLEARVYVNAWRRVRKTYPEFRIRLFLSTTTTVRNYRILAETPPEIRIERACATELERVRHLPRDLMRNPLLDDYAARGRWIASYDVPINVNGDVATPEFKLPESSAHRIRDYVRQLAERRYGGAYGMMAWRNKTREICGFNIAAHAEWSWNLEGRTEREFAVAWAVRQGSANPEAVAEWSELMGPLEFDVYDSDFPTCYSWGKAAAMVKARERPYLGEGMFRYYASPEDFDRKIATCEQALAIAAGFKDPYLAHETRVVLSYVKLAQGVYHIAAQVAAGDPVTPESQAELRGALKTLRKAGEENVAAIKAWRTALGPEPWHRRVHAAVKATEATVADIAETVGGRWVY